MGVVEDIGIQITVCMPETPELERRRRANILRNEAALKLLCPLDEKPTANKIKRKRAPKPAKGSVNATRASQRIHDVSVVREAAAAERRKEVRSSELREATRRAISSNSKAATSVRASEVCLQQQREHAADWASVVKKRVGSELVSLCLQRTKRLVTEEYSAATYQWSRDTPLSIAELCADGLNAMSRPVYSRREPVVVFKNLLYLYETDVTLQRSKTAEGTTIIWTGPIAPVVGSLIDGMYTRMHSVLAIGACVVLLDNMMHVVGVGMVQAWGKRTAVTENAQRGLADECHSPTDTPFMPYWYTISVTLDQ